MLSGVKVYIFYDILLTTGKCVVYPQIASRSQAHTGLAKLDSAVYRPSLATRLSFVSVSFALARNPVQVFVHSLGTYNRGATMLNHRVLF